MSFVSKMPRDLRIIKTNKYKKIIRFYDCHYFKEWYFLPSNRNQMIIKTNFSGLLFVMRTMRNRLVLLNYQLLSGIKFKENLIWHRDIVSGFGQS